MALLNQIFGSVTLNYLQLLSISDTALTIRLATQTESRPQGWARSTWGRSEDHPNEDLLLSEDVPVPDE